MKKKETGNSQLLAIDEVLSLWRFKKVTEGEALSLVRSLLSEGDIPIKIISCSGVLQGDVNNIVEWMNGIISVQTRAAISVVSTHRNISAEDVFFRAYVDYQIVGYSFCLNNRSATCVRSEFRYKGIGKRLFARKVKLFKRRNPSKILHTVIDNDNQASLEMVGHTSGIEVKITEPGEE